MIQISKFFLPYQFFQLLSIKRFNFWKNKDLSDAKSVSWSSPSDVS